MNQVWETVVVVEFCLGVLSWTVVRLFIPQPWPPLTLTPTLTIFCHLLNAASFTLLSWLTM